MVKGYPGGGINFDPSIRLTLKISVDKPLGGLVCEAMAAVAVAIVMGLLPLERENLRA